MRSIVNKIELYLSQNQSFKQLLHNSFILFSGGSLSSIFSLLGLAILTRALELNQFGTFALIISYVALVDRIANFQTWQALIHYGTAALKDTTNERISSLLAFGFLIDLFTCAMGFALGIAGIIFLPNLFGLETVTQATLIIPIFTLLFNWLATPTAILRLLDKYKTQVIYINIASCSQLIGYIVLWRMEESRLWCYLSVWAVSIIISRIVLLRMTYKLAVDNNIYTFQNINIKSTVNASHGIWRFIFITNLDGIVRILRELDIFIVNSVLGTTAVAFYKIARDLTKISTRITGPFHQVIYPELSRLTHEKNFSSMKKLMLQSSISVGTMLLIGLFIFLIIGKPLIELVFGIDYVDAYITAAWCIAGITIWGFAQPLLPGMIALGKVENILYINLITNLIYIGVLYMLSSTFGVSGSGFSLLVFHSMWAIGMICMLIKALNKIPG